ncbi:hypothetical protein [Tabrizicola sp.]|uniref:hypothetical protein n=1 Tax=Tabrizicola sp. TaxID=2005166 RepID=UPI0025CCD011|nr:hypothetical protein [Tabrizicola sp.]
MAEIELTARERARLDLISDKLIADARAEGLTLTRDQVEYLPSVRLFVLSEHDAGGALEEAKRLPELQAQLRAHEVQRQLHDAESDLHKTLAKNPHQRLAVGHQIEAERRAQEVAKPKHQMTAEEESTRLLALRQVSSPSMRLHLAREWGLA